MSEVALKPVCGIVMPISACDGCTDQHWVDVKKIISSSITEAGLHPNLVSEADEVGVIHKTIIQNLANNPIVICDVSGKNPNVMFELGIRLAFDKATIIIKDDKTDYSFDTSVIQHIPYPRDLRHNQIEEFKLELISKINNTYGKSTKDSEYSTFLKHFHQIKASKLGQTEVSNQDFILEQLKALTRSVNSMELRNIEINQKLNPPLRNFGLLSSDEIAKLELISNGASPYVGTGLINSRRGDLKVSRATNALADILNKNKS